MIFQIYDAINLWSLPNKTAPGFRVFSSDCRWHRKSCKKQKAPREIRQIFSAKLVSDQVHKCSWRVSENRPTAPTNSCANYYGRRYCCDHYANDGGGSAHSRGGGCNGQKIRRRPAALLAKSMGTRSIALLELHQGLLLVRFFVYSVCGNCADIRSEPNLERSISCCWRRERASVYRAIAMTNMISKKTRLAVSNSKSRYERAASVAAAPSGAPPTKLPRQWKWARTSNGFYWN